MEETIDKLAYNFSRVVILLPILFIIFGVSLRVMGYNFSPSNTITRLVITPSVTVTQSNQIGRAHV